MSLTKNSSTLFYLIVIFFLLIAEITQAKKVEGYYISNQNDTVKTYFYVFSPDDYPQLYSHGVQYLDSNNQKKLLKPNMVREIDFTINNKKTKLISKISHENYFLLRVIDDSGYLKLYSFSANKSSSDVFQKGSDILYFQNFGIHTRKKLIQYFSDCQI